MILILAPPGDVHASRVAQEIEAQGHTAQLADWRRAGEGLRASLRYVRGSAHPVIQLTPDVAPIRLADVRAVWNRRPGAPAGAPAVLDEEHRRFAAREWQEVIDGLLLTVGMGVPVVNPPPAQRAAVKPYQLAVAQQVGLRVPDTLVTNDPRHAAEFIEAHAGQVVHKAMTSPLNAFLDTRRWSEADRAVLAQLPLAPTIFQEFIDGPRDIRATIVGPKVYAAAFESGASRAGIDSRLDLDVPVIPYDLPGEIVAQLRALMARLGLILSTVDLKVSRDGSFYFLEVNPQGQFLYVEILTGQQISAAVAQLLVEIQCDPPEHS